MDQDRVCYGRKSVEFALNNMAVETLFVSDKLFRAKNLATRKVFVSMVERAERDGMTAIIFSSMHPSGERLDNLSGVAALLRYPLPGLDDIEEEDIDIDDLINQESESDSDSSSQKGGAGEAKGRKMEWDEEQLYQML
jgi:protein pelota